MPQPARGHVPVLLSEVLTQLNLQPGDDVIDATLGGGGHARSMLEATAPNGRVLAIEADPRTLAATQIELHDLADRITFVRTNAKNLKSHATQYGFTAVAGALFDLGLSSIALADQTRGFSFQSVGPLDMRLDPVSQSLTAAEIVQTWTAADLTKIFREYGQEPLAQRIANTIVESRRRGLIVTTTDLVRVVVTVKPRRGRLHPATQVFQALRMVVNDELENLSAALAQAFDLLRSNGRLAVISFHSVEDKLVKEWMRAISRDGRARLLTKHVIPPTRSEILSNPRSRSAKLRSLEKTHSST